MIITIRQLSDWCRSRNKIAIIRAGKLRGFAEAEK